MNYLFCMNLFIIAFKAVFLDTPFSIFQTVTFGVVLISEIERPTNNLSDPVNYRHIIR